MSLRKFGARYTGITMPVVNTPQNYVFGRPAVHDLKALADHLSEWSKDPHNYDILSWINLKDVDPRDPPYWASKDKYFSQAWYKAKCRIAERRSEMVHTDGMSWNLYNKYQHNYDVLHTREVDKRKKKLIKYQSDLNKANDESNTDKLAALAEDFTNKLAQNARDHNGDSGKKRRSTGKPLQNNK